MTNVTKRKTSGEDYRIAYAVLIKILSGSKKQTARYFINELLTETEKIMLVKRFAAIFMFHKQYSPYRVSNTVSLSVSTAQRLYNQYQTGHFSNLLESITPTEKNRFLTLIEDLIIAQASPRARARIMNRVL